MSYMIGVDVGGTFTDFSVFDQETGELFNYKDSSTPADPSKAIVKGVQVVKRRTALCSDLHQVFKSLCGDKTEAAAFLFDQRIGSYCGTMCQIADCLRFCLLYL